MQDLKKATFKSLAVIFAVSCLARATLASAQTEPAAAPTEPAPQASGQTEPAPQRSGQKYFYLLGGSFSPERDRQLGDENGKFTLGFGFGSRRSPHIAWELDIPFHYHSVNAPDIPQFFLAGTSERADILTIGLAGNVRLIYPSGRFEPYLGGGLGLYYSRLEVTRFIPNLPGSFRTSDINVGLQLLAGVDYFYGEKGRSIGLQYRKLKLDAGFGSVIPGSAKVGGDSLLLNFRWSF